ncbi:hypothetical protein D3C87_323390 [compost metagenome]
MTLTHYSISGALTPKRLPAQGDFVLFGNSDLYYVAQTEYANSTNHGLKFIAMDDGNRNSDDDTIEQQIRSLEADYGEMRIVKRADIHLTF